MSDLCADVDTAIVVPVSLMPLVDRTDFITIEDAIAYNEAGMALVWNFYTTAGVMTSTDFTPTTAGVHDWAEVGTDRGMYSVEIPAFGGTVDNDTEGFGWISGETSTTAPFRGPTIVFRSAALNNALVDGTDLLDVNTAEISDSSAAADALEEGAETIVFGTCGSGSTSTVIVSGLTTSIDQHNGSVLKFKNDTTTTALQGLGTRIQDTDASGNLTVVAIPAGDLPVNTDTFTIL